MKVVGVCGYSGAGKTVLIERLIPLLRSRGLRVSVIKHAHHRFDIDHPGKDTYRHREAGAHEVLIASDQRLALVREFETPTRLSVHQMLAELDPEVDWVLVEGFRHADLPKIEVWRASAGKPAHYAQDEHVRAVATDSPLAPPPAARQAVLDLNDAAQVADWLLAHAVLFAYSPETPA